MRMSPELRDQRIRLVKRLQAVAADMGESRKGLAKLMRVSESAVYDWWRAAAGSTESAVPCGPSVAEVEGAIRFLREARKERDEQQQLTALKARIDGVELAPPPPQAAAPQPAPPQIQTPLARKDFTLEQAIRFRHLYWHSARRQIEYVRRNGQRTYRASMGTRVWERAAEARDVYERGHGLPLPSKREWQKIVARNRFKMDWPVVQSLIPGIPGAVPRVREYIVPLVPAKRIEAWVAPEIPPPPPPTFRDALAWRVQRVRAHADELGAAAVLALVVGAVLLVELW